jgi:hypothetical protein
VMAATKVRISGNLALMGSDDENTHVVKAGSASIFLESKVIPKGFLLTGQVIDSQVDWVSAVAEAWQEDNPSHVCILDETCEFTFELISSSPITLYITAASGITLMVKEITIQT